MGGETCLMSPAFHLVRVLQKVPEWSTPVGLIRAAQAHTDPSSDSATAAGVVLEVSVLQSTVLRFVPVLVWLLIVLTMAPIRCPPLGWCNRAQGPSRSVAGTYSAWKNKPLMLPSCIQGKVQKGPFEPPEGGRGGLEKGLKRQDLS